jgi:hypothetical protein
MAAPRTQRRKRDAQNHAYYKLKCSQINLHHSRAATDNIMQLLYTERTGIALIQEPYLYQNRPLGIPKGFRIFTAGAGKRRAAIVITDNITDALLISQISENDAVQLEIVVGKMNFFAASIYLDYHEPIENNIRHWKRF